MALGAALGLCVGDGVPRRAAALRGVGKSVGRIVGLRLGESVGETDGRVVGLFVGRSVGLWVGREEGATEGVLVGLSEGTFVGELKVKRLDLNSFVAYNTWRHATKK